MPKSASSSRRRRRQKVHKVMHEFKHGHLHSGRSGNIVHSRRQAVAIALSMARRQRKHKK